MSERKKRFRYRRWRYFFLSAAFLLILVTPILNLYFHFTFVQGWYQSLGIGRLWIVSPLEGLESLLISKYIYLPSLIGMLIPVIVALYLGRVFCSWVCPISFLHETLDRIRRRIFRYNPVTWKDRLVLSLRVLWVALIGEFLLSMILGFPIFVFVSPPGLVGRELMLGIIFHTFALEGFIILVILLLHLVTRRFYCRYLCPLGGLLAFLGQKRRLKVRLKSKKCSGCGICEKVCPLGLPVNRGGSYSPYCWNCGECVDYCPTGALKFYWKRPYYLKPTSEETPKARSGNPLPDE